MITAAMDDSHPHVSAATFSGPDGEWQGIQWRVPAVDRRFERADRVEETSARGALPADLSRPLPPQKQLPRPLSPSGAGTIIDEEADNLLVASPLFSDKPKSDRALQKGRLLHRMLQMLPEIAVGEQAEAAKRYVERAARFWPEAERIRLVDSVLKLLESPDLKAVFATHAQAEVSIMGTLSLEGGDYAVSGRVDRLAVLDDRVVILDYKTNRVPPETADGHPVCASGPAGHLPDDPGAALSRQADRLRSRLYRERVGSHADAGGDGIGACTAQDKVKYRSLKSRHRTLTCASTGNPLKERPYGYRESRYQ
jgi:ATP-dependent helicase/nuclease subunit A